MKMSRDHWLLATAVALFVAGCATVPPGPPPEVARLQSELDRLHSDPVIADNAGTELANADAAVDVLARNARTLDARSYDQGVYIADRLIGIAEASALARAAEHRGAELGIERERLLAQNVGTTTVVTTVPQRVVRTDTIVTTGSGELVPRARAELMAMQNQLPGVESRLDARGLVIRLGDYMFEPGRPELTPTAEASLDSVARVLRNDTDAGIAVEAFGADGLADRRAASVRDYLDARGVDPARIATRRVAYAPGALAENDRRVDIVIRSDIR
ncbi:MAG TPA: OmpA family protein [Rhodanobacteraceae bacterium]|jgi:outer membrane protein OmpA-like peptidoglycan-associated protein